ncbi:hypothetical protein [Vibrio nereis]|uniref:hypothetical protein n=1 Tax=Vibrio nereis TaxID=693 RepID=UPI00249551FB|nr:hypothetical protein [Vibrio nereis]
MKRSHDNLHLFIKEHKAYFMEVLAPVVNEGVSNPKDMLTWEANGWNFGSHARGFLCSTKAEVTFHELKKNLAKGVLADGEEYSKSIIPIDPQYAEFTKAYCTMVVKNHSPSSSTVRDIQLLLKRVYVRMIMGGINPNPINITSQHLQDAVDLLASSRTGKSKDTNAANDYHAMNVIAEKLNYLGIPQMDVAIDKKVSSFIGSSSTESARKQKKVQYAEDLDEENDEKNLSIQAFLNIVALRNCVAHEGEKILLNLVLLLMVTGFRLTEATSLRYNSFRVIEIEDKLTKRLMEMRGLPTYYLGLMYIGEKGAGHRMHWVEPAAIELVESIWVDTLCLSEKLRRHTEHLRKTKLGSLLPKELSRICVGNGAQLDEPLISLDDLVEYVYESYSETARKRSYSSLCDYTKKKIENAKHGKALLGIKPASVENLGKNKKTQMYRLSDVDKFLRAALESDAFISNDLILRVKDSKTKSIATIPYEELLFIIPQGSGSVTRAGALKPVPQHLHYGLINKFLGYGQQGNRERSIFAKYGLKEEDGQYTMLYSHIPRHAINTFFAIAGVSDHLQAMFMGRTDVRQNKSYQHLAIEEKKQSSVLVDVTNAESLTREMSALHKVKSQAAIGINPTLPLGESLAQSMHTFTTSKDRTSFIVSVVEHSDSDIFGEFDELFDTMDIQEKKEVVKPHSDLAPMGIGSCMRDLCKFQCPFNMKCQDGAACAYFTLTGREDEPAKVGKLAESIESQITIINQMELVGELTSEEADEMLHDLDMRKQNVEFHLGQSQSLESEKIKVNLVELDGMKKPKMLSSLFALEHRELKKREAAARKHIHRSQFKD